MRTTSKICLAIAFTLVSISAQAQYNIKMAWDNYDTTGTCVQGFNLYRTTTPGQYTDANRITSVVTSQATDTNPYIDTTAPFDTPLYYVVRAVCPVPNVTESASSNEINTAILSAPKNFTTTCSTDGTQVTVKWDKNPISDYYLLRFADNGTGANGIGIDSLPDNTYTQTVTPGKAYDTWVHAHSPIAITFNKNWGPGIGPSSNLTFTCQPAAPPPPPPAPAGLKLAFISPVDGGKLALNQASVISLKASPGANLITYEIVRGSTVILRRTAKAGTLQFKWQPITAGTYYMTGTAYNAATSPTATSSSITVSVQ